MQTPNKHTAGMLGQQAAEDYLVKKNYRILQRNYRVKSGEIDLIAQDGAYLVFVEVKSRSGLGYGHPREAVNAAKQARILRTAQHYIIRYRLAERDLRFDVIEVLNTRGEVQIEHIENAFWTG
ncbi:MAG: YraN family protein [Defluviitaleaceae bacterium]|nr:YraN family protein [Defluviitaleaceae bacterium]